MEKLKIEIDLEKLTKDLLESETYSDGNSTFYVIENKAKEQIKQYITSSIVSEITKNLSLNEFVEKGWQTREYLKRTSDEILSKNLSELVQKYTENWIKNNMKSVVEREISKNINELLIPRVQKLVSSLIVVNKEKVDEELKEMEDYYNGVISDISQHE
jgi:uncharacterized membrane protein YheB (UPF0754 family)